MYIPALYELDDLEPLHAEPKEDVEIVVTARLKNIQYMTASSGAGSGNQYLQHQSFKL
jgi:hypothetical protein